MGEARLYCSKIASEARRNPHLQPMADTLHVQIVEKLLRQITDVINDRPVEIERIPPHSHINLEPEVEI